MLRQGLWRQAAKPSPRVRTGRSETRTWTGGPRKQGGKSPCGRHVEPCPIPTRHPIPPMYASTYMCPIGHIVMTSSSQRDQSPGFRVCVGRIMYGDSVVGSILISCNFGAQHTRTRWSGGAYIPAIHTITPMHNNKFTRCICIICPSARDIRIVQHARGNARR